ncbi:MAG: hypothetical protein J6S67_08715 [Methanobrevibacter sp.]|nr:hypothetical protein [Methanobrevibacter sp.]
MGDFKVIETQEEFDKAIQSRLKQKDRELADKYKDYLSPDDVTALKADFDKQLQDANKLVKETQDKLSTFDETVSNLTKRAEAAEKQVLKNRVAYENKLPIELSERLIGNTEEELKADAEKLSGIIKPNNAPPLYTGTQTSQSGNTLEAGMAEVLASINAQFANQ